MERLASGDETVLTEMLAEIDPDGSLKEMMADFSDPAKLSDPAFLAQIQEKLLGNGDMKVGFRNDLMLHIVYIQVSLL